MHFFVCQGTILSLLINHRESRQSKISWYTKKKHVFGNLYQIRTHFMFKKASFANPRANTLKPDVAHTWERPACVPHTLDT